MRFPPKKKFSQTHFLCSLPQTHPHPHTHTHTHTITPTRTHNHPHNQAHTNHTHLLGLKHFPMNTNQVRKRQNFKKCDTIHFKMTFIQKLKVWCNGTCLTQLRMQNYYLKFAQRSCISAIQRKYFEKLVDQVGF